MAAVTFLEHAAVLSDDGARRAELLLCAVEFGRPESVYCLLDHARSTTLSPRQYATVVRLHGSFHEGLGGHPGSVVSLPALAESVAADDPARSGPSGRSKG